MLAIFVKMNMFINAVSSENLKSLKTYKLFNSNLVPEWVNYLLDDAPASEGLLAGKYLGQNVYVGRVLENGLVGGGSIRTQDPKGAYAPGYGGEIRITDSNFMWFLADNENYLFKWVTSGNGSKVPFAVEVSDCEASDGFFSYISKVNFEESTTIGTVFVASGYNYYVDMNKIMRKSNEYTVLTCRSKVCKLSLEKNHPSVNFVNFRLS